MEQKYHKEIELLKKGHDYAIRETIANEIETVLQKSYDGSIGIPDFINDIKSSLLTMQTLSEKYFKQ